MKILFALILKVIFMLTPTLLMLFALLSCIPKNEPMSALGFFGGISWLIVTVSYLAMIDKWVDKVMEL